jgi:hypothetical protein
MDWLSRLDAPEPRSFPTRKTVVNIKWPRDLHRGTPDELRALARLRKLPGTDGLEVASVTGHLFFATLADAATSEGVDISGWARRQAWILTDPSRRIALARRLDGEDWCHVGAKSWMLRGSDGAWPIGAGSISEAPSIGVVEGGPDFLALWHVIVESGEWWAPVCVPSACRMSQMALPFFYGRDVFLFPHADDAGMRALDVWSAQLREFKAARVKYFPFAKYVDSGTERAPKDLNEFVTADEAGRISRVCPPAVAPAPASPAAAASTTISSTTTAAMTAAAPTLT